MRIVHGMSDNTPSASNAPKGAPTDILDSEFKTSESITQLCTALAVAQGLFPTAQQGAVNPHFQKSYSNIADVWDVCRNPMSSNGLSVIQCPTSKPGADHVTLVTRLAHKSGEWIEFRLSFKAQMSNPQNAGSVITYMKRYALQGLLGIVSREDDDDGETGAGRGATSQNTAASAKKAAPPAQGAPAGASNTAAAPPIPEAAASFCKRFSNVQNEEEFHKLVTSTREAFDDGTPEKMALSTAIKEAAKRLGIQPKKPPNQPSAGAAT